MRKCYQNRVATQERVRLQDATVQPAHVAELWLDAANLPEPADHDVSPRGLAERAPRVGFGDVYEFRLAASHPQSAVPASATWAKAHALPFPCGGLMRLDTEPTANEMASAGRHVLRLLRKWELAAASQMVENDPPTKSVDVPRFCNPPFLMPL